VSDFFQKISIKPHASVAIMTKMFSESFTHFNFRTITVHLSKEKKKFLTVETCILIYIMVHETFNFENKVFF